MFRRFLFIRLIRVFVPISCIAAAPPLQKVPGNSEILETMAGALQPTVIVCLAGAGTALRPSTTAITGNIGQPLLSNRTGNVALLIDPTLVPRQRNHRYVIC